MLLSVEERVTAGSHHFSAFCPLRKPDVWPDLNRSQPDTRKKKLCQFAISVCATCYLWPFCLVGISLCILLLAIWQYHNTAPSDSGWAVPSFTKVYSEYCGCGQFIHPDRVSDSLRSCIRQFQLLNVWPV